MLGSDKSLAFNLQHLSQNIESFNNFLKRVLDLLASSSFSDNSKGWIIFCDLFLCSKRNSIDWPEEFISFFLLNIII